MANPGSDGEVLHGQLLFGPRQTPIAYTKQSVTADEGTAAIGNSLVEVDPTNRQNSEKKVYTQPNLSGYFLKYVGYEDIELPNVLSSLSVTYESGGSDGVYNESVSVAAAGTAWSVGSSVNGTAQAAAFCIPKLLWTITEPPSRDVKISNCFFYVTDTSEANILSILTAKLGATVLAWPLFKPKPLAITLIGQRVSANGRQSHQGSASFNSGSGTVTLTQGDGFGEQYDYSPVIDQVQLPATIHGSFSLTSSSLETHTGTTTISLSGGILSGGGTNTITATANGSVTPTSIAATSPAAIPTSGLYAYRINIEPNPTFGNYFVFAKVFDFAYIA